MATVDFDVPLYQLVVIDSMANSGCNIARMRYEVVLAPEAVEDPRRLKANVRANVRDAMETCLRHQPTRASRSRIKRLRGMSRPQYRLRVDEVRVFYDVGEDIVEWSTVNGTSVRCVETGAGSSFKMAPIRLACKPLAFHLRRWARGLRKDRDGHQR